MEGAAPAGLMAAIMALGVVIWLIWLAICVFMIIVMWKIFSKANQPGWAAIIPIYNTYILLKVADKPWWWLLLLFIPFVNIVAAIILFFMLPFAIARNFGQGSGFAIGLMLLPIIFYPILAFGSAQYGALSEG